MYPRDNSSVVYAAPSAPFPISDALYYPQYQPPYSRNAEAQCQPQSFQIQPHLHLRTDIPVRGEEMSYSASQSQSQSQSPQSPAQYPAQSQQMFDTRQSAHPMSEWSAATEPQSVSPHESDRPWEQSTPLYHTQTEYYAVTPQHYPPYPPNQTDENPGSFQRQDSFSEHVQKDSATYHHADIANHTFPYQASTNEPASSTAMGTPAFQQHAEEDEPRARIQVFEEPLTQPPNYVPRHERRQEQEQQRYGGHGYEGSQGAVSYEPRQTVEKVWAHEEQYHTQYQYQQTHEQPQQAVYHDPSQGSYETYNEQQWTQPSYPEQTDNPSPPTEEPPMEALRPDPPPAPPSVWRPPAPTPLPTLHTHTISPYPKLTISHPSIAISNPYSPQAQTPTERLPTSQPPRHTETVQPSAGAPPPTQNVSASASGSASVAPTSPVRPAPSPVKSEPEASSSQAKNPKNSSKVPQPAETPTPVVPSQAHLVAAPRLPRKREPTAFKPFHPYPAHQRAAEVSCSTSTESQCPSGGITMGLFGSYPLSFSNQPLPGPTCAPETSSSVMRLVLSSAAKKPNSAAAAGNVQTPPPPAKRPRMACFFCRKRKIACGPGPQAKGDGKEGDSEGSEASEGGSPTSAGAEKNMCDGDDEGPCNQCARRGLQCVRPTESRRGVRKGRGRDAEGNANEEMTATLELAPRRVRSCGEDHVHDDEMEDNTEDTCMVEDQNLSTSIEV